MTTTFSTDQQAECPVCNNKASKVSPVTLGSLLNDDFACLFQTHDGTCCDSRSTTGETGWRFCGSQNCDVVYFSEDSDSVFRKSQLKVQVGIKEKTGKRPLCYCFGHSIASITDELATTGKSNALEDIRVKMKDLGCRCETENPSGLCCLGSVGKGIHIAQSELGMMALADASIMTQAASRKNRGERIAKVGIVVSAIMASSCCWLPMVLLAVGVSGAGIASTLEVYRPLFITITFGFLGAAFYFTYRPRPSEVSGGNDCRDLVGEDCCVSAKGRFNMMSMNKIMLWGITAMTVAFLFFPSYGGAIFGGDGNSLTENMNQAVIKVEGMTCEGCSYIIAEALKAAPSVLAVEVNYEKGEAIVGTENCCPIPRDEILTALENTGYKGKIISEIGSTKAATN